MELEEATEKLEEAYDSMDTAMVELIEEAEEGCPPGFDKAEADDEQEGDSNYPLGLENICPKCPNELVGLIIGGLTGAQYKIFLDAQVLR